MIRPVTSLTPKVAGKVSFKKNNADIAAITRRNEALVNAAGVSLVTGAFTALVMRTCTSSWKNAGILGAGAAAVCTIFMLPNFIQKAVSGMGSKAMEATSKTASVAKPTVRKLARV